MSELNTRLGKVEENDRKNIVLLTLPSKRDGRRKVKNESDGREIRAHIWDYIMAVSGKSGYSYFLMLIVAANSNLAVLFRVMQYLCLVGMNHKKYLQGCCKENLM